MRFSVLIELLVSVFRFWMIFSTVLRFPVSPNASLIWQNQISILTMVSEFVLSQTQTTLQDHFLQASKTYTNSFIAPSKPIQKNIISTLKKSWILQHSLPLKNCSSENVWCNSSPPQAIFDSKFFHSLSSWRNNNHDRATVDRTPFSIEQLSEHE